MKTTTFIYSFLGCFLTSAAVARSLYMDVGQNSKCDRYCLMNPNAGQCCPDSSVVSKLEISADGYGKIFEGLYFNGIKLFDYDGTPRDLSLTELLSIKNAASGIIPTLAKKQYNQGTQFVVIGDDGEWSEQSNPTRGEVYCDHVKFVLDANGGNGGLKNVYYKAGEGFYSDAARTNRIDTAGSTYHNNFTRSGYTLRGFFTSYLHWNTTTDTGSYINNLQPYRTIGHAVIRWNEDVHNTPGASAYLEFPSTSKVYPTRSCPDDNKTESSYPTSDDLHLYAGWAKQCVDTDRCTMTVSGPQINGMCRTPANGKVDVCGRWLPGAVEYQLQGSCYGEVDGLTQSPAKDYTTPYVGYGLYFTLGTANLTCSGTQPPQNYTVDFQESWESFDGKTSNWTCDSVANTTCALNGDVTLPTTAPSCYRRNRTGSSNTSAQYVFNSWFNESYRFLNNDSALKFKCNESGDYSAKPLGNNTFTGLRSFACLKNPSVSNGNLVSVDASRARYCKYTVTCKNGYHCNDNNCIVECRAFEDGTSYNSCDNFNSIDDVCVPNSPSPDLVDVILDTRGGELAGGTSVKIAQGGNLGAYVPDRTMYDGAIFVGWAKSGQPDSAANKNAVVDAAAGTSVTYRAVYRCPDGYYKNDYDVCVSDEGEYIDRSGAAVSPGGLRCWRPTGPNGTYENYCYWETVITFHDVVDNNYMSNNYTVTEGNDGLVLDCHGGRGCYVAENSQNNCCTGDSSGPVCEVGYGSLCQHIRTPHAKYNGEEGYSFRGYFRQEHIVGSMTDLIHSAFSNFFPKNLNNSTISISGPTVVVMNDTPVNPDDEYSLDVYGGWAVKCRQSANSHCTLQIGNTWNMVNGLRKGNVRYDTWCDDGYSLLPNHAGTFNPICEAQSGELNVIYQFIDQHGLDVTGCSATSAMCTIRDTYNFVNKAVCGSNTEVKYFRTYDGLHRPNNSAICSENVFGAGCGSNGNAPCVITGYVCRNACHPGDNIDHGTCLEKGNLYGGYIGNEYIENIWADCPTIECSTGYKPSVGTGGNIECVPK